MTDSGTGAQPSDKPLSSAELPPSKLQTIDSATQDTQQIMTLIFEVSGAFYAVDAHQVQQILWLPELQPAEEVPFFQVGIFNLNGRSIPVIDLDLRFGHPAKPYRPSDCVIVLTLPKQKVLALIANEALDIQSLCLLAETEEKKGGIQGKGQFNDELVMLLDANALYPEPAIKDLYPAELIDRCDFVSQAEPEIRAIFAERRQRYKTLAVGGESEEKKEIMIVTIGTERFGLDMPEIKEVADIGDVIKIPCCPSHVLGNMNLRGDIVTVFSLARLLGQAQPLIDNDGKLIVYEHESLLLAILVDNIVDVMFIDTEQILPPPLALDKIKSGYIAGEILLESVVVSLLDIRQIIHQDELVVDDSD